MAKDRINRSSPWLKRVLIPFWVVQLLLMLFIFIIFIWLVSEEPEDFAVYVLLHSLLIVHEKKVLTILSPDTDINY